MDRGAQQTQLRIEPVSDRALVITVGETPDERTRLAVRDCYEQLSAQRLEGVHDIVPGFTTVTVHYDPAAYRESPGTPYDVVATRVGETLGGRSATATFPSRVVEIPVCYDASVAPDLEDVAVRAGLEPRQVAELHAAPEYVVHMIGFLPGFPYLGGLDARLSTPRRPVPRTKVPAGSVAIGGMHTGVYTIESPGGWQLIGRTPMSLFDVAKEPPALLRIGDRVRFRPITLRELGSNEPT